MIDKVEKVCTHMQKVEARGFTIKTATTTMDVRGPKNDFFSIHLFENGKLVKKSETRRDMVIAEVRERFKSADIQMACCYVN